MKRRQRILSECKRFFAERIGNDDNHVTSYRITDAETGEIVVDRTTYWSNRSTDARIGFETGSGPFGATFSYPRYPRWFRRRWVSCFDAKPEEVCRVIHAHGGQVLDCFKPSLNCWVHVGFRAGSQSLRKVDAAMTANGWKWDARRKAGRWDVDCPADPEKAHKEVIEALEQRSKEQPRG